MGSEFAAIDPRTSALERVMESWCQLRAAALREIEDATPGAESASLLQFDVHAIAVEAYGVAVTEYWSRQPPRVVALRRQALPADALRSKFLDRVRMSGEYPDGDAHNITVCRMRCDVLAEAMASMRMFEHDPVARSGFAAIARKVLANDG